VKRNFCEYVGKRGNGIMLPSKMMIEMILSSPNLLSDMQSETDDEHLL
jgi:hypothetical protein